MRDVTHKTILYYLQKEMQVIRKMKPDTDEMKLKRANTVANLSNIMSRVLKDHEDRKLMEELEMVYEERRREEERKKAA